MSTVSAHDVSRLIRDLRQYESLRQRFRGKTRVAPEDKLAYRLYCDTFSDLRERIEPVVDVMASLRAGTGTKAMLMPDLGLAGTVIRCSAWGGFMERLRYDVPLDWVFQEPAAWRRSFILRELEDAHPHHGILEAASDIEVLVS
jgi:hypothetical protein